MGLAALKIERGEDRRQAALAWQRRKDWLEARLVPLLWQARYGANHAGAARRCRSLRPGSRTAALSLGLGGDDELVELITPPFVERLILGGSPTAAKRAAAQACRSSWVVVGVAPRQYGSTKVRLVSCQRCWGNGWAKPDHRARATHLCLTTRCYFKLELPKLFALGLVWLRSLIRRGSGPLRRSLGRRKVARWPLATTTKPQGHQASCSSKPSGTSLAARTALAL